MLDYFCSLQITRNKFVDTRTMISSTNCDNLGPNRCKGTRSHSAQGLASVVSSPAMKIPLPPRPWITDAEDDSSDDIDGVIREEGMISMERTRMRSRYRHHKQRQMNIPIGIFWDIENCQIPRGCSAIELVAAIRAKFVRDGRREADFVVVCDVRKETTSRLLELNDAQVSLIHVCRTQKNASDDKLRQCMRRFGDLHSSPAAILLISGDIDFAADLTDFRYRKNMEVILVHKNNTSAALIACASSHYCFDEIASTLPRKVSKSEDETPTCEVEVLNLPIHQPPELVSIRLRHLAKKCGGKVISVTAPTAVLRFSTPDHASRALMRMDGEDVYGRKISTRYARNTVAPTYSSDEGYSTAPASYQQPSFVPPPPQVCSSPHEVNAFGTPCISKEWALALQQLPAPTPPPHDFCPPPAPKPRKIRGTHGSVNLDRSGCSSSNSGEGRNREHSASRAVSPWNSSASFSEHSETEESTAELTVTNLPPYEAAVLQEMLTKLFNQYVPVVRVSVWAAGEGPLATVVLRSEWDARLAIARIHKRRLDNQWTGRRLELSLGKPSPAPNVDVLRARLRAILLDQKNHTLPLLRLRDAYASRHCCALTTSDIAKLKDTVVIHEGFGRMVQLVDLTPVSNSEMEEAPWKCHIHASMSTGQEDGSRILQPVYMEISTLAKNVRLLLETHGGILPLLSFVECYEARFDKLVCDARRGVALEMLLRSIEGLEVRDAPSRHITWKNSSLALTPPLANTDNSESSRSSGERERLRTAPALEPMLALFERELIDLLRTAPRCSIPFSKLIPAFHHHFGRQCRVADYGFTKLPDLLAALGNTIVVLGSGSSRIITISPAAQSRRWTLDLLKLMRAQPGRTVQMHDIPQLYLTTAGRPFSPVDYGVCTIGELMQRVNPEMITVNGDGTISLPRRTPTIEEKSRSRQFALQPDMLDAETLEGLVYAAGGCVENNLVVAPGGSPVWAASLLAACAVLSADRSIARGSTLEYFTAAYKRVRGFEPDLRHLAAAGVLMASDQRLNLSPAWRAVWRLAQLMSDHAPATAEELFVEYSRRYEPAFPGVDPGAEGLVDFLRQYMEIFTETDNGRWTLCPGVVVPRCRELVPGPSHEDYSVHDTPPGQKGSRVFESPKTNIWCSPPASALPTPTALLNHENRRRVRLAAHFDVS
ncbi:meiosis regulator and mRNA stability factor 1 isoform X2 [Helicoverpa armigera]|uniref:meiosis regulator and mRNA stability factor 1 isoform X2 n=1 Tax=Helicoverpa zea TaxID=7113 RepID=UPI001F56B54D|nr:meiosis regulator and mRNA stability factor 1 isoform X2 [Helicoverpa armigera]XP_047024018.1 meiosis regulator and mRNA stability factor 1 isoform X2 [Helicoverpa zea]